MAASAIVNTEAMASDATTQVEPHSSANCVIDRVSSSMKPAPSKKNCQEKLPASEDTEGTLVTITTENTETASINASAAR